MNQPFFKQFQEEKNIKVKSEKKEISIQDNCEKCGLYKKCISPKMKYTGEGKKKILIVAEAPGQSEDETGIQLKGRAGQIVRNTINQLGFDLEKDCWKTNAIICHPENNKTPTNTEIQLCKNNLLQTIKELQPEKIIILGKTALESLIGHKASVTDLERWTGWEIPDQEYNCFIYPTYHPSYLLRNGKNEVLNKLFHTHLFIAFNSVNRFRKYVPKVQICNEEQAIENLLNLQALKEEIIAIDFETSGLKPYSNGHFIYSVAITQSNMFTFSFLLTALTKTYLNDILRNNNIGKIAHNCQFEKKWSSIHLTDIQNIIFDTQLSTHILDNRSDITGLKFQTYVNFGIIGYEDKIKKYLESKEKGANEFNTIKNAPVNELLLYNGYDTYFTMLLYKKHSKLLDSHLQKGFQLFLDGNIELSKLSGIKFDKEVYDKNYQELTNKIDILHNKIIESEEASLMGNNFNYNSDKQLRELLFDKLKWKSINKTASGVNSVDEKSLKDLNKEFTNNILERRKLCKIRDTYLDQFIREASEINGEYFIFPFFSLNNVKTFRSASQSVNFQNIPARNDLAKTMTRNCIVPRRGHQLLELDFKAMEVCTSCCYHLDPVMIDYVANSGDMHKDLAKQLFFRTDNDFTKFERYCAKNGFVFPSFYGSTARIFSEEHKKNGYGDITKNIWEMIKDETKENLAKNKINNIYDFQEHVEAIESDFWGRRFKVYQQWKFDNWRQYKENGYVELKTGFRCNSIMSFNDVNNYPIQGSAFHILLKVLIELNRYLLKEDYQSVIIGQIHDSLVLDVDPAELNYLLKMVKRIISKIREEWKWIIVPLTIEAAITEVNKSWYTKKEINF